MSEEVKEEKTASTEEVAEVKEEAKAESAATEAKADKEPKAEKKKVSAKFKEIVEKIENLSVLELSELVKELEDRFGVSAAAPMMMAGAGAVAGAPAEEVEEKTSYDVIITSAGDKKIQVIKVVREIKPELGLKEAKDLVEAAPKELAKGMKKEDAEAAKAKLEAAGAGVELK